MKDLCLHSPLEPGQLVNVLHVRTAIRVLARAGSSPAAVQGLAGLRVGTERQLSLHVPQSITLRSHPHDSESGKGVRNEYRQEWQAAAQPGSRFAKARSYGFPKNQPPAEVHQVRWWKAEAPKSNNIFGGFQHVPAGQLAELDGPQHMLTALPSYSTFNISITVQLGRAKKNPANQGKDT